MEMSRTIEEIRESIKTQDNRITDQPMFVVQQKVRDSGYDPDYCDDYEWYNHSDYYIADDEEAKKLDENGADDEVWVKKYYKERWEFVTACFTEQGCKDYLKINGHNLKETRIYAEGSWRNAEFQTVRNMLIEGVIK